MKNLLLIANLFLLLNACNSEKEVSVLPPNAQELKQSTEQNKQVQDQRKKDYQEVSPSVDLYIEPNEKVPDVMAHNNFITSSGMPKSNTFFEWQLEHDINQSLDIYKSFLNANSQHKYITFFKQFESWLLITHYDLLGNSNNINQVNYLLNELIDSKYKGYPLMFYCTKYLADNNAISSDAVQKIYNSINSYASVSDKIVPYLDNSTKSSSGKPLPPAAIEMVNKEIKEKNEGLAWVEKIKEIKI